MCFLHFCVFIFAWFLTLQHVSPNVFGPLHVLATVEIVNPEMHGLKGTYHAKCTFGCLLYINMCPRCVRGTHKVSENKTLSLFLRTQISKNGAATELIQICVRYDVISEMWTHGTIRKWLSETMPIVLDVIWLVFTFFQSFIPKIITFETGSEIEGYEAWLE